MSYEMQQFFFNFVKSPRGVINLSAPPYVTKLIFYRETQVFGSSEVKSKHSWQLAP